MAVVIETTLGDITIDLYINERPKACLNFLKLCKIKYFNFNLFHTVNQGFIAQTGDPTGSRIGGESIWGVMEGPLKRYFEAENTPRIKHTSTGLVSFVGDKDSMIGSQFFITLAPDLTYLDAQHCVFGEVAEGFDVLRLLNEAICDSDHRPYQDIRITHTVVLEDPFPDPENLRVPDASPEPTAERLQGGRIAPDEEIDETEGKTVQEVQEIIAQKEAKARATILEMIGDIPDADMAPPENVLFVCKLNPVTNDDDLEIIFSRFGKIKSCEVIRDKKTGDSLQYAFVEFEEQKSCEDAYFKMDNVLIDDRRIHVDFSQSVAKIKWHGKGRGVTHYNDRGETEKDDPKNDVGNGRYKRRDNRDSPNRKPDNKREDKQEFRDRYENGNFRNRNFNSRQNQRNERNRDDRFRQDNRNKPENYNQEHRRQRSSSRDERFKRNRSRSIENTRFRQEQNEYKTRNDTNRSRNYQRSRQIENDYNKKERSRSREYKKSRQRNISPEQKDYKRKQDRSRSRSRNNQRTNQVEREYKRREEKSRSRENQRSRRNLTPEERNYKRKQERNRSRSRDDNKSRQRNIVPEEKENRRREIEKNKSFEKDSSEEEVKKKKKSKKKKKDSSSDSSSSEDDTPVKKSKKSKKKKSKKKKRHETDSSSESDSEEERKKTKKKKKKSKKYESSNDSESDSDSDVPQKKRKH